jgi:hypothetical protein
MSIKDRLMLVCIRTSSEEWEGVMQEFGIATVMAVLFWSVSISGSASAPVTSEDLTGKTICWHDM